MTTFFPGSSFDGVSKMLQGRPLPTMLTRAIMIVFGLSCLLVLAADCALADSVAVPEHPTRRFVSPLFLLGVLFGPIVYLATPVVAAVGLVGALVFLGRLGGPIWSDLPWWVMPALIAAPLALAVFFGPFAMPRHLVWAGFAVGLVIWHLIRRRSGKAGLAHVVRRDGSWLGRMALGLALVWIGYKSVTGVRMFVLLAGVWISPPDLGNPPYATARPRDMTPYTLIAVRRFPDAGSCLIRGSDPARPDDLNRMDWDRIDTTTEAEVCMFRLLSALGSIDRFTDFVEAQGFRVSDEGFNPSKPYVEPDGSLRVTAYWSIRANGPKYPTTGLQRYLMAVPYSMSVDAVWAPDRRTLRSVDVSFTTL